jgi:hypothetical protein
MESSRMINQQVVSEYDNRDFNNTLLQVLL